MQTNHYRVNCQETGEVYTLVEELRPSPAVSGPRRDIATYSIDETGEFVRPDGVDGFVGTSDGMTYVRTAA